MRLLFIADGRSPTAMSWINYWIERGHETHLISTYPCSEPPGLESFTIIPVAFANLAGQGGNPVSPAVSPGNRAHRLRSLFLFARYYLGPLTIPVYQRRFRAHVQQIHPDLIHALRIPFEGMLAGWGPLKIPLLISIWGNDLTLHAHGSFLMGRLTRRTLAHTAGLLADTERDIRLAYEWGLPGDASTLVVPGSGGIRTVEPAMDSTVQFPRNLPDAPIVVNPRGQRPGSLRQDAFFKAIPLVLEEIPNAQFICPSLEGDPEAESWIEQLGIFGNTWLWSKLEQPCLWALMRKAQVYVSPSLHDGTPNSLLEAMACGCFPVVGDIESMREWITNGSNGFLVNANSPQSIAEGIIHALKDPTLMRTAGEKNASTVAERADYQHCMAKSEAFYQKVLMREKPG